MAGKIIVTGLGCCLVDMLFNNIDFNGKLIRPYLSRKRGDGGLIPGQLVFREEFEKFCGTGTDKILNSITGGKTHSKISIGGPSIVSLINVSQLADQSQCEVRYCGRGGNDANGQYLLSSLKKTAVSLKDYVLIDKPTPSTIVLSDQSYDKGNGERMFINSIGAAADYRPDDLDDDFYNSDIVVFGGTALVPQIHDNITSILHKARSRSCITIVNTVFDFRNEKANPSKKWPLGRSDESYKYIDLLITDREEALRLSGETDLLSAIRFFRNKMVSSLVITNGSENISLYSDGRFFTETLLQEMPVSQSVVFDLKNSTEGDTTGCGDNFTGGVIASIVAQLKNGIDQPDLKEACCLGIVSGGFTCFYTGGTYFEEKAGEKSERILPYYEAYKKQISSR